MQPDSRASRVGSSGLQRAGRATFGPPSFDLALTAAGVMERSRPSLLPPIAVHPRVPDADGLVRLPASFAQARGWDAEELLSGEIRKRERQWRRQEQARLSKNKH